MNWEETVTEEENRKTKSEEWRAKPTTSSHLLNIKREAPVICLHGEKENFQENGVSTQKRQGTEGELETPGAEERNQNKSKSKISKEETTVNNNVVKEERE